MKQFDDVLEQTRISFAIATKARMPSVKVSQSQRAPVSKKLVQSVITVTQPPHFQTEIHSGSLLPLFFNVQAALAIRGFAIRVFDYFRFHFCNPYVVSVGFPSIIRGFLKHFI